jgi:hypothetical protein
VLALPVSVMQINIKKLLIFSCIWLSNVKEESEICVQIILYILSKTGALFRKKKLTHTCILKCQQVKCVICFSFCNIYKNELLC